MTTIGESLYKARRRIASVSDSSGLDAQALLGAVLGVERAYLFAHPERPLTVEEQAHYENLVDRCAAGEPLAYILGRRAFYDRVLIVSPAVLIPRPETELLLEEALACAKDRAPIVAVDVGTGSGALAVTLAAHCPQAQVYATDISPEALAIAQQNAANHAVKVTFFEGDLLVPLVERGIQPDVIMANLPYIARDELAQLPVSRYEPRMALDGGPDGLDLIRRLLGQIASSGQSSGLVLLEIGADQGQAVLELAGSILQPQTAVIIKDYARLDRLVKLLL